MSNERFIPQLWADAILESWNDKHVFVALCNRDYEGQIKDMGDTVKIHSVNRPTVLTYTKGSAASPTTIAYENVDDGEVVLQITESKHFAIGIDDIDKVQSHPQWFKEYTDEGAWALADDADVYITTLLDAGNGQSTNTTFNSGTDWTVGDGPTDHDFYGDVIVNSMVLLDEQNVPDEGRWIVINPRLKGVLFRDPRFVSFGTPANRSDLKNGVFGSMTTIAGLTVYVSNNVPWTTNASTDIKVFAGHKKAVSYASQITKSESLRLEANFRDGYRALHVYGGKVTRPYAIVESIVNVA